MIEAARTQRDLIVDAIEAYHTHFGFYPPDHVVSRNPLRVDPITNTLVYELGGTTVDGLEGGGPGGGHRQLACGEIGCPPGWVTLGLVHPLRANRLF